MYAPDQLNAEHRANPIYRSSVAPENDDHHQHKHHHHQHENADYHDADLSISNIQITPQNLLSMCPALLVQIEQGSCSDAIAAAPIQQPTPKKEIKDISNRGNVFSFICIDFHCFKHDHINRVIVKSEWKKSTFLHLHAVVVNRLHRFPFLLFSSIH